MKKFNLLFLLATLFLMLTLLFSAEAQKKYTVFITFKNGEKVKGKLIRTTHDSLSVLNALNSKVMGIGVSEIKSIRIRKRGSVGIGIGIGAGTGAIIGAIVGAASYKPQDCPSGSIFCDVYNPLAEVYTAMEGAGIGVVPGLLLGAAVGSAGKEFEIEGNQAQFEVFANKYSKK